MEIIKNIVLLRQKLGVERKLAKTIGLVPTMGYLHEGHLSLVREARKSCEIVVMTIFVNPLQFGPQEDYAAYPRDFDRDALLAEKAGVDFLFNPDPTEMYPSYPQDTTVSVKGITEQLCGKSRPGHFTGVATVVSKLFGIVQPDKAFFGQKDYQQVLVIKRMAEDLNMPIAIVMVPIKREKDGLAMSSRNAYLSAAERKEALSLNEALQMCLGAYREGQTSSTSLKEIMIKRIKQEPSAVIEYIEVCDADDLRPIDFVDRRTLVALAVRIGKTRLIDNLLIGGTK